jgi:hypothetical protein
VCGRKGTPEEKKENTKVFSILTNGFQEKSIAFSYLPNWCRLMNLVIEKPIWPPLRKYYTLGHS